MEDAMIKEPSKHERIVRAIDNMNDATRSLRSLLDELDGSPSQESPDCKIGNTPVRNFVSVLNDAPDSITFAANQIREQVSRLRALLLSA